MTKNVIIADDRQNWREMYVQAVRYAFPAVNVDEVKSGADLVERVLQGDYSIVISDNDMEEKNAGLKALQKIRESGSTVPYMDPKQVNLDNKHTAREVLDAIGASTTKYD